MKAKKPKQNKKSAHDIEINDKVEKKKSRSKSSDIDELFETLKTKKNVPKLHTKVCLYVFSPVLWEATSLMHFDIMRYRMMKNQMTCHHRQQAFQE